MGIKDPGMDMIGSFSLAQACHIKNEPNAIQMKSHLYRAGAWYDSSLVTLDHIVPNHDIPPQSLILETSLYSSSRYGSQHSLLKLNNAAQQVPFNQLSIWIR